tara:strand:- start:3360 stop:5108 length:1749 start_codon:yes stop_codon:yes gene_type:complete
MKRRNIAILVALFVGASSLQGCALVDGAKDQLTDKLEFLDGEKRKDKRINFYMERALEKKWKKRDYEGAINDFTKAIEVDPDHVKVPSWYNHIASIKNKQLNDYYGAIRDYTKAISKTRENSRNLYRWYKQRGYVKTKVGDYRGAIEDHTKQIQLLENYSYKYIIAKAYAARALNKGKLNDYQGAINDYTNAIELNPTDWAGKDGNLLYKYYSDRASLKVKLKDYQGAISDADMAIKFIEEKDGWDPEKSAERLKGELGRAYSYRADAKKELKDYSGAIKDFQKAIEIYPYEHPLSFSYPTYHKLANTYYLNGDIDSSCAFHNSAKLYNKDSQKILNSSKGREMCKSYFKKQSALRMKEMYYNSGVRNEKSGKYKEAISDYTKAIEINPNNAEFYKSRSNARYRNSDYQGAENDLTKAIEINPNDYEMYLRRGYFKDVKKDYEGAISDYTKAIEINRYSARLYYSRGNARFNLNDNEGAKSDLSTAIKIDPNYIDAYKDLGYLKRVYEKDYQGAIEIYTKAIEIESLKKSTRAFLYAMRALTKEDAGDMKGACSDAKKSKSIYFDPRDRVLTERVCKRFWEQ